MDFRSEQEKQNDVQRVQAEQSDYRQMYQTVLADNNRLHDQLEQVSANHAALQTRMSEMLQAFEDHRQAVHKQNEDMLQLSRSIEEMVTHSYQKNQTLLEQYRTDINQRLTSLREQAQLEHKP